MENNKPRYIVHIKEKGGHEVEYGIFELPHEITVYELNAEHEYDPVWRSTIVK